MGQNSVADTKAARLLDEVYNALRGSNYSVLDDLAVKLDEELLRPSERYTADKLQTIRRKAERNSACLMAAQRGIRAAHRRLADIRSAASGLTTYDRSGKRAEVSESRNLAQRL